jgi:hypothetical protein
LPLQDVRFDGLDDVLDDFGFVEEKYLSLGGMDIDIDAVSL